MLKQSLTLPRLAVALLSAGALAFSAPAAAQTLRVSTLGDDANSGATWGSALRTLQAALSRAGSDSRINRIEIAAGTYKPGGSRSDAFSLVSGLTLAGGYPAAGGASADPDLHETILSGDIGVAGELSDNCYSILVALGVHGVRLDGLRIRYGVSLWTDATSGPWALGGGLYAQNSGLVVTRCRFYSNLAQRGGAVSLWSCAATFTDCVFESNGGLYQGGAIDVQLLEQRSDILLDRCRFLGNQTVGYGGAVANMHGILAVHNSMFSGNLANNGGGGVYSYGATQVTRVVNSSFANNSAPSGSDYYGGESELVNSIFWNHPAMPSASHIAMFGSGVVHHCVVQGLATSGVVGWANLDVDPQFVDPLGGDGTAGTSDDDLHLRRLSPCVNAGDNAAVATFAALDIDRTERVQRPTTRDPLIVDIGADELGPLVR